MDGCCRHLKKPLVCEAKERIISNNEVIQHRNLEQFTGSFQILGQLYVGLRRLQVPRRMVMCQYHTRSQTFNCLAKDQLGIGYRSTYASLTYPQCIQHIIGPVQQQDVELLIVKIG